MSPNKNIRQLILQAKKMMDEAKIPESHLEAEIFMMKALNFSRTQIYTEPEFEPDKKSVELFFEMVRRRMKNEPSQYIIGKCEFMGLDFDVNENVLIPRCDTEILVETALEYAKEFGFKNIAEIGTGSGCIAISLAYYGKINVVSADISEKALQTAVKNAEKNGVSKMTEFILSDVFKNFKDQKFDAVVSNPPYIKRDIINALMPEVREHEPISALDGGYDGLRFYRRISSDAKKYLNNGGWIFYEIGYDQSDSVREILNKNGYTDIKTIKDISGLDRVVVGRYKLGEI
jgi:release factor glutamine methyltransferase